MAKKSEGPNKSQAIRDYHDANPSEKPKQVAAGLKAQGVTVTPAFVSTILSNYKKKSTVGRPGRPAGAKSGRRAGRPGRSTVNAAPAASSRSTSGGDEVSIDSLLKVKKIVAEMGSVSEARNALSAYEKLMS